MTESLRPMESALQRESAPPLFRYASVPPVSSARSWRGGSLTGKPCATGSTTTATGLPMNFSDLTDLPSARPARHRESAVQGLWCVPPTLCGPPAPRCRTGRRRSPRKKSVMAWTTIATASPTKDSGLVKNAAPAWAPAPGRELSLAMTTAGQGAWRNRAIPSRNCAATGLTTTATG